MSDDLRFGNLYRVPSARLASWDYRWAGIYHVTLCTHERVCWFGDVKEDQVMLSTVGKIVAEEWQKIPRAHPRVLLDEWILMPDHLHGILVFQNRSTQEPQQSQASRLPSQSLGAILGQFKSSATKRIRLDLKHPDFAWQARFYDTVLRDSAALDRTRAYLQENPVRWSLKNR